MSKIKQALIISKFQQTYNKKNDNTQKHSFISNFKK